MYTIKEQPEDFKVTEQLSYNLKADGAFALFVLEKRNHNTYDALEKISSYLSLPVSKIGYCGNKDRIAITKQYITIPTPFAEKAKKISLHGITLHKIGFVTDRLNLGDLDSNEFEIIVRDAEHEPKDIDPKRVLNLFGEQRFSTHNADIGRAIIREDFKGAVNMLIHDEAYAELLRNHLEMQPNDYVGALRIAGTSLLRLFVHAYQSRLWNKAAEQMLLQNPDIEQQTIPILGFGNDLDGTIKDIYEEIMEDEDITQRDFIIRKIKELSAAGQDRPLFMEIEHFKITQEKKEKSWKLSFALGKGSYATTLITYLFGND